MIRRFPITAAVCALVMAMAAPRAGAAPAVRLDVLDVGYGAAVHLQAGDAHYLFDVGPSEKASEVIRGLSTHFVTRLDGIFLTHTHPDHVGGLLKIASQIPVDRVYWNERLPNNEEIVTMLAVVEKVTDLRPLAPAAVLRLARDVRLRVLDSTFEGEGLNDTSLVFGLDIGKFRVLLPGDIGPDRQANLIDLERKFIEDVDWLLWPHHGDRLHESFLAAAKSIDFCVVSVNANPWGMPAPALASQQSRLCRSFLRTDRSGPVSFELGRRIRRLPAGR